MATQPIGTLGTISSSIQAAIFNRVAAHPISWRDAERELEVDDMEA